MNMTYSRRIELLISWILLGMMLSILPSQQIACKAKALFPVLADIQDRISVMVGRPVAYADVQDYAHIPFFAVLTYLLLDYLTGARRMGFGGAVAVSLLVTGGISILVEAIQYLTPGRDPSVSDLTLDFKGWAGGFIIYLFIWLSRSKK